MALDHQIIHTTLSGNRLINEPVTVVKSDIWVPDHTHNINSLSGLYTDHSPQYLNAERGTDLFNTLIEGVTFVDNSDIDGGTYP